MPKPKANGHGTPPTQAEVAAARADGTPWKILERRFGFSRTRLWEIANGVKMTRSNGRTKDVVTTSD